MVQLLNYLSINFIICVLHEFSEAKKKHVGFLCCVGRWWSQLTFLGLIDINFLHSINFTPLCCQGIGTHPLFIVDLRDSLGFSEEFTWWKKIWQNGKKKKGKKKRNCLSFFTFWAVEGVGSFYKGVEGKKGWYDLLFTRKLNLYTIFPPKCRVINPFRFQVITFIFIIHPILFSIKWALTAHW